MTDKQTDRWQPIETAPKDGTWILLTGGKADFDDYMNEIISWPPCCVCSWIDDAWAFAYWDGSWRTSYDDPTHWMPLPEPPEGAL